MKSIGLILLLVLAHQGYSMEFRWGAIDEAKEDPQASKQAVIYASGEIRSGDFDRLRAFLRKDFDAYIKSTRTVTVNSNGGDIVEAIKVGGLLRDMYAEVDIAVDGVCVSACFLLYVSAIERNFTGRLGVHRPYFDQRYFAGLRPPDAEKKQLELTMALNTFLERNDVPRALLDKMNSTSSKEIYWLNEKDFEALGRYPNWFEEFLIAKCHRAPSFWEGIDLLLDDEKAFNTYLACRESFIMPEIKGRLREIVFRK
jgi:hypothetical protein